MPTQVHPLGHDPQRFPLDQPGFERIEIVVGRTRPHRPQRPVPFHDQAVLPDAHNRELAGHRLQGEVIGGGQFQRVPVRARLALVLLAGDVEVAQ